MNPDVLRAYAAAAGRVAAAFEESAGYPDQEVTPPPLIEAIEQCLEIFGNPDEASALPAAELQELGTHALNCVSDLALWAAHLELDPERAAVEALGLEFAQWLAAHDAPVAVLEPVVNALARRANAIQDPARLAELVPLARRVIASVPAAARSDPAGGNAWLTLNFNYAIIATRTQRSELMEAAYDLLEANLPDECPAFFEEGLRESKKAVYGPHVGEALRQRLAKRPARH